MNLHCVRGCGHSNFSFETVDHAFHVLEAGTSSLQQSIAVRVCWFSGVSLLYYNDSYD